MQTQESMYSMLINAFINFINAAFKLIINLAEWFKAFTFIKSKSTSFISESTNERLYLSRVFSREFPILYCIFSYLKNFLE